MAQRMAGLGMAEPTVSPSTEQVRRTLIADGHGNHAGLAVIVLRAAILGINEEEAEYEPDSE